MANKEQPTINEQKIQTKYDKKMEERRKKEAAEKRNAKIAKLVAAAIALGVIALAGTSYATSVANKKAALNDPYVTVGNHQLTKLEYDYHYNSVVSNYIGTYGSILSYIGLDTSKDFSTQQYSETMTWKDMFDQMTVDQITQSKALSDEAGSTGFTHDSTEEYNTLQENIKSSATTAKVSVEKYYQTVYGNYATVENMEPYLKETILAGAYYENLLEKNAPSDQEVKDYYAANKNNYDKVDYHSFTFTADIADGATEEETKAAMDEAKKKADDMLSARLAGTEFKALCLANASEEEKATYQDEATDASLKSGQYQSAVPVSATEWLYDDARKQGDATVIEDTQSNQYYVIEFVNKYFDEADNETISNTLAGNKVTEHITQLTKDYQVTDHKGELKYLIVEETTAAAGEEASTEAGAETTAQETTTAAGETTAVQP